MKSKIAALTLCVGLLTPAIILNFTNEAKAEYRCSVTDPTGTPLNVRSSPNGRVITRLKNGTTVYILEITTDSKGRPWARVGVYVNNGQLRSLGWVFREFISCY